MLDLQSKLKLPFWFSSFKHNLSISEVQNKNLQDSSIFSGQVQVSSRSICVSLSFRVLPVTRRLLLAQHIVVVVMMVVVVQVDRLVLVLLLLLTLSPTKPKKANGNLTLERDNNAIAGFLVKTHNHSSLLTCWLFASTFSSCTRQGVSTQCTSNQVVGRRPRLNH